MSGFTSQAELCRKVVGGRHAGAESGVRTVRATRARPKQGQGDTQGQGDVRSGWPAVSASAVSRRGEGSRRRWESGGWFQPPRVAAQMEV